MELQHGDGLGPHSRGVMQACMDEGTDRGVFLSVHSTPRDQERSRLLTTDKAHPRLYPATPVGGGWWVRG